jgi:hypothetical protein
MSGPSESPIGNRQRHLRLKPNGDGADIRYQAVLDHLLPHPFTGLKCPMCRNCLLPEPVGAMFDAPGILVPLSALGEKEERKRGPILQSDRIE